MLWAILVILLLFWLVGLLDHIGGVTIHILLVIAVAMMVFNLMSRRGAIEDRPKWLY